jgi:hypothetical protein
MSMKKDFALLAEPALPVTPIKVDNGNALAFVFGSGPLTVEQVHFIASNTGISRELEGPDFTEFSAEDRYLAAKGVADKCGTPCVVVAVLDESRATWCARGVLKDVTARAPANQPNRLSRFLRRTFG